jgi:diguanylate cyclase (GGDEF)-like protein
MRQKRFVPSSDARLLLVDDDPFAIHIMGRMLSQYPNQRFATSGEVALRLARDLTPDVVLLDADMPGMTGFDVCEALKSDPDLAHVPVIFVTSRSTPASKAAALQKGAADFIVKPLVAARLKTAVQAQLRTELMVEDLVRGHLAAGPAPRQPNEKTPRILIVDDDPGAIKLLSGILCDSGHLRFATSGEDALRLAREVVPDLILLDAEMPGMSGYQVFKALKAEPRLADVAVIFVTIQSEASSAVSAFEMGAADYITKPVNAALVRARVRTQLRAKRLTDELRHTATTDSLTGLASRRQFDELYKHEWLRAQRAGDPVALLLVDVDHFKLYNDRYGHPSGDVCLRKVAEALVSASLRRADLVARYGGEEFMLLLSRTPRHGAEHIAHRILDAVEALDIPHEASPTASNVTVSVGIGCLDTASVCRGKPAAESGLTGLRRARFTADDLVLAADKALYCAKVAGRAEVRLLDIADVYSPQMARDIAPSGFAL